MREYQNLPSTSKKETLSKLDIVTGEELCLLLLSMSELDDWEWVQETYLKFILHEDQWVAAAAITGLGHLARISGKLNKEKVIVSLKNVSKTNPDLESKVWDTISDINMFV